MEAKQISSPATNQSLPAYRVWLCGLFRLEQRVGEQYEVISSKLGESSRTLLQALHQRLRGGFKHRRVLSVETERGRCLLRGYVTRVVRTGSGSG
jgi:hypothetical protein